MVTAQEYLISAGFRAAGLLAAFLGYLKMKTVKLIKDTPLSSIRDIKPGFVKVQGKASAERYLKSPFSVKDCVLFRWVVKTYRSRASSSSRSGGYTCWQQTSDGQNGVPFSIDDGTGKVRINPNNAEAYLTFKNSYYKKGGLAGMMNFMRTLQQMTKTVTTDGFGGIDLKEAAMQPVKSDDKRWLGTVRSGDMMLYEYYIAPGENVFVLGNARKDPAGNLTISRPKKLIISNKTPEGTIKEAGSTVKVAFIFGLIFFLAGIALLLKFMGYY